MRLDYPARIEALRPLVGGTPLVGVACRYRGRELTVWAKLETLNLTGSVKDRMALWVLEDAWRSGRMEPGAKIVEATSGNTGISLAAIGKSLGHDVRIYMPDWLSRERRQLILAFGAEIVDVSAEEGGFVGSIERAEAEACEATFLPRQFENAANAAAHERTTGPEILAQLAEVGLVPDAFVAGVGTGGTVMGVGRALRAVCPGVAIHPLEPANSPTLQEGHRVGTHRIQGISDEFVPALVDLGSLDAIVDVWDGDAIITAQRLSAELGLGVGISSGANFLGALQLAHERGAEAVVVTVFPDSSKKYLTTDLARTEPPRDDYQSNDLELLGMTTIAGTRPVVETARLS